MNTSNSAPPPAAPTLLIRAWRTYRGMTQEALAECMGTSKSIVSTLENGQRRWNADHLVRAAKCLDCQPFQLLTTDPTLDTPIEDLLAKVPARDRARVRRIIEAFLADEKNAKPR